MIREVVTAADERALLVVKACFIAAVLFFGGICFVAGAQYQDEHQAVGAGADVAPASNAVIPKSSSATYLVDSAFTEDMTHIDLNGRVSKTVTVTAGYEFSDVVLVGPHWGCGMTDTIPHRTECHDYATGPKK